MASSRFFYPSFHLVILGLLSYGVFSRRASRPNIVLLITDDQDVELGSMKFMPKTLHLIKDRGVSFESGFVTTPICCPSRSTILTGLYVHNHNVLTNNQNCSGPIWRNLHEKRSFAVYVRKAGYRTAYFGKYLNEYDGSYIPPGWEYWMGLIRNSRFYNYTINFNGERIKHGFDYEKDYFTDLIANDTIAFIHDHFNKHPSRPFLAVLSFPAPHGPEDPAPQYSDWFQHVETHRTMAWNYAPNPDKQWLLQHTGRMEPIHVVFTDVLHRRRLQTLQSVDHNVQRLFNELRDLGELSNTYFIYTSDHGYHLGQFGLVKGKNMPYEFDIRVPFFIRGPNLPKNISIKAPVMNVDIAPTILDMAGIEPPNHMDGRSLIALMRDQGATRRKNIANNGQKEGWRHTVLIERGKMTKMTRIRDRLHRQRARFNNDARVQLACSRPEFTGPCTPDQQWKCVWDEKGNWRIWKCHENLEIAKECLCERNTTTKRRFKRFRMPKEKLSIRRVTTIAQLDKEGGMIDIEEELVNRWEKEFVHYIQQKEIFDSGEWFQGIFDDPRSKLREKRSVRRTRGKSKKERELNIGPMCTHSNMTVLCEPIVFVDSRYWEMQKTKIDDRIENLRRKLSAYKDARKFLKRGRPTHSEDEITSLENVVNCQCSVAKAHPLRSYWDSNRINNQQIENERELIEQRYSRKWVRADSRKNCNAPQMNCFVHYADHWRTPPLWPAIYGEFCFCQNSNNNTYWCLRTINETHNFLYCEFITEFISYYDLKTDPFQLQNTMWSIPVGVLEQLSKQLGYLRKCVGELECEHYSSSHWNEPFVN